MDFKNISFVNKQIFINLSLGLFTEYRSAKFKNNGKIVFWFSERTLFRTRNTISFKDLIFKYIPLQLSHCKWNSNGLYSRYFDQIADIFNKYPHPNDLLYHINEWFADQLDGTLVTDLSSPVMTQEYININPDGNLDEPKKRSKKNVKIRINSDVIDPYIQRVKRIDKKAIVKTLKTTVVAAVVATLIRLNVAIMPIAEREIEIPTYPKKSDFTEQPLTSAETEEGISILKFCSNNTTKNTFFDSS